MTVARIRKATLLSNDQQARQTAQELGIAVSDTVAVLEHGVETGRLGGAEAVHILEEMIRQGAWITAELFEVFKQKVLKGKQFHSRV